MSDKIYDLIEDSAGFSMDEKFIHSLLEFAINPAISDLNSYWRSNPIAKEVVNDNTFKYLWVTYPKSRDNLLTLAKNSAVNSNDRYDYGVTKEFCEGFVQDLYDKVPIDFDDDNNALRVELLPYLKDSDDFDYLAQICEFTINPEHHKLYSMWEKSGLRASKDPNFYNFLWSRVKREQGATESKVRIVSAAHENGALSDLIIGKIAKSSPKSLKRVTVSLLCEELQSKTRSLDYANMDEKEYWQEKVDSLEAKVMLFVSCDDSEIVANLIDSLSKDNLPWLMPSASKHSWLARRLQQKIDWLTD